jgi:hypothetical protein
VISVTIDVRAEEGQAAFSATVELADEAGDQVIPLVLRALRDLLSPDEPPRSTVEVLR